MVIYWTSFRNKVPFMDERIYTVYVHISPNNKYYVGITKQSVKRRWHNGTAYRKNTYFYSAIQKYGWDNFQHEIIAEHLTKDEACDFEITLIAALKSNDRNFGYNHSAGGEGFNGITLSPESRQKIREKLKGRKRSEEFKKKFSEARMGHLVSEETKEKISNSLKQYYETNEKLCGSKIPKELRKKQTDNARKRANEPPKDGRYLWIKHPINQYDSKGNFIKRWDSIKDATEGLNFKSHGSIDNVLSGRAKTAHGFIFRYADE